MAIAFSIFAVLSGCDSSGPVSEPEGPSDERLMSMLVDSTSDSENYKTDYYSDNTFLQRHYAANDSGEKVLSYIRYGNFRVEESILRKTDLHMEVENPKFTPGQVVFYDKKLSIVDNKLHLRRATVLENKTGSEENIWGTWTTVRWTYIFPSENRSKYFGRQKYFYTFKKGSGTVKYGWKQIDGEGKEFEFESDYTYDKPHLELEAPAEYDITVRFKNGKMYWLHGRRFEW